MYLRNLLQRYNEYDCCGSSSKWAILFVILPNTTQCGVSVIDNLLLLA